MTFNYKAYILDRLFLFRILHFSKILNYVAAHVSHGISILLNRPVVWGGPFSLNIETAAICNLQCPECMAGTRQTKRLNRFISEDLFEKIINFSPDTVFWCNLYFQGEPLLNRQIYDLTARAAAKKYYTVIASNGHLLTEKNCIKMVGSGLSRIIISLDGATEEAYSNYRKGGDFEKVTQGIRQLAETKKRMGKQTPYIAVQFLVNRSNEHQLPQLKKLVKSLGADALEIKTMQIYSEKGKEVFIPENKKYSRYKNKPSAAKSYRGCFRLWSHMVFTSDGLWAPCCYDKIPTHAIAPDFSLQPATVWKGAAMQEFRSNLISGKVPDICHNCSR